MNADLRSSTGFRTIQVIVLISMCTGLAACATSEAPKRSSAGYKLAQGQTPLNFTGAPPQRTGR
jgi:Flp pilus assembly protein TadD